MNTRIPGGSALAFLLWAGCAIGGDRADYAQQWNLELGTGNDSVYQVILTPEVYARASQHDLRDLEVFNGPGQSLPTMLTSPIDSPVVQFEAVRRTLPLFDLPASVSASGDEDITLLVERSDDGRVRSINTRMVTASAGRPKSSGWLLDASGFQQPVRALMLEWANGTEPLEQYLRVEGSDDLRTWHLLESRALLLNLIRDGERLRHDRIEVDSHYRYLRLLPQEGEGALRLTRAQVDLRPTVAAAAPVLQWRELEGRQVQEQGRTYIEFQLDGLFPIEQADVHFSDNDTNEWTLHSRDSDVASWSQATAPWVAYGVSADGVSARSATQPLYNMRRDREWRLSARTPVNPDRLPVLRLGYRPEALVFLVQGKGPFALAVGNVRAEPRNSSLPQTIAELRRSNGSDWAPPQAHLGDVQILSGDRALQPSPPVRDWKTWLLWGLLIVAALLVTGFAFSLIRKSGDASDQA